MAGIATARVGNDRRLVASPLVQRARPIHASHNVRGSTQKAISTWRYFLPASRATQLQALKPASSGGFFFCSTYGMAISNSFGVIHLLWISVSAGFSCTLLTLYYYAARHDICTIRYRQTRICLDVLGCSVGLSISDSEASRSALLEFSRLGTSAFCC
jgi:hypothetical protein